MKREKPTPEQREELRTKLREKRSAFLTRMVDEFKKIGFIAIVVFCIIVITWCMVLYTMGMTTTGLHIVAGAAFSIMGVAFSFYCTAASSDKKSLNNNGIVKNKDGTFSKILTVAANAATTILGKSNKEPNDNEDVAG